MTVILLLAYIICGGKSYIEYFNLIVIIGPHINHTLNNVFILSISDSVSYSVAALSVLAELLAPLLDVLYVSEEKDKVVPLLTNIMAHVIPYLRNHT